MASLRMNARECEAVEYSTKDMHFVQPNSTTFKQGISSRISEGLVFLWLLPDDLIANSATNSIKTLGRPRKDHGCFLRSVFC